MSGSVLARSGETVSLQADVAPALREHAAGRRASAHASDGPVADTRTMVPLTTLSRNATGIVAGVRVAAPGVDFETDPALERMALRLIEIGFVQGAQLRVIAFGQPGDDPIGVRVGGRGGISSFALRRQEASCVWVWPDKS
ncbi:MAG: FeoA family protein [Betaproteobacteria bacterium]